MSLGNVEQNVCEGFRQGGRGLVAKIEIDGEESIPERVQAGVGRDAGIE